MNTASNTASNTVSSSDNQHRLLHEVVRDAAQRFAAAGITNAAGEARLLAAHFLAVAPTEVFLHLREPAPAGLREAIARREQRQPLQHIIGTAPFGPLELFVGPGVFIPRPETEVLAQWAVDKLSDDLARGKYAGRTPLVLDLCTGTGALAAYIAHEVRSARVLGVEYSPQAWEWAKKNRTRLQAQTRIEYELHLGDVREENFFSQFDGQVDLIVSNPPYVPRDETLSPEVYADPDDAVFAGVTGMDVIDDLAPLVARLLRPGGLVGIEHDDSTSRQVQQVLRAQPDLAEVTALADLTGRDRFVTAAKRVD